MKIDVKPGLVGPVLNLYPPTSCFPLTWQAADELARAIRTIGATYPPGEVSLSAERFTVGRDRCRVLVKFVETKAFIEVPAFACLHVWRALKGQARLAERHANMDALERERATLERYKVSTVASNLILGVPSLAQLPPLASPLAQQRTRET